MMLYNHNVHLVNENVYTKFGLISSISPLDIEIKPNYVGMTERERERERERDRERERE